MTKCLRGQVSRLAKIKNTDSVSSTSDLNHFLSGGDKCLKSLCISQACNSVVKASARVINNDTILLFRFMLHLIRGSFSAAFNKIVCYFFGSYFLHRIGRKFQFKLSCITLALLSSPCSWRCLQHRYGQSPQSWIGQAKRKEKKLRIWRRKPVV